MKTLWKTAEMEIILADENNFDLNRRYISKSKDGVESDATTNVGHYNKLQHAIKRACELRANDRCEDLQSWIKEFKASIAYFEKLFN